MRINFSELAVPEDWDLEPLQSHLTLNYGKSPNGFRSSEGNVPIYGTGGKIGTATDYNSPGNAVLVGRKGTLDNPIYIREPFWAVDTTYFTSGFTGDSEWLYYLLHTVGLEILSEATGVPSLSRDTLYRLKALFPPREQQAKIAQVLATLDRAIAQTDVLLAKQQRVKAGLMQELLTRGIDAAGNRRDPSTHAFKDSPLGPIPVEWQSVPCSNLASKITKGTTPSTYGYSYTTSGVTYIRVEAIKADGTINKEALLKISETAHRLLSRSELTPGDVLVTIAGAIGRCAVVNKSLLPANCNQAVAIVRVKLSEVIPEYLRLFFSSAIWQNYALAETVQLAQANISLGQLGKSLVALPPIEEQERICTIAASETLQVDNGTKSLKKLKSIKAGLMQDLLTGRVSVLPLFGESL